MKNKFAIVHREGPTIDKAIATIVACLKEANENSVIHIYGSSAHELPTQPVGGVSWLDYDVIFMVGGFNVPVTKQPYSSRQYFFATGIDYRRQINEALYNSTLDEWWSNCPEQNADKTPPSPKAPEVARQQTPAEIREEVLNLAAACVLKDRNKAHGEPEDNFRVIAGFWNAYLGVEISPTDVANMMALMKIARLKHNPQHTDSWVDLAGYAACGAGIALKKI